MELNCRVCLVWPYFLLYGLVWPYVALYGLMWPYVAFYGFMWPYVALYGLLWSCCFTWPFAIVGLIRLSMALCVLLSSCMAFYGLVTHFKVFYGRILPFLAVIDPNTFGLVYCCMLSIEMAFTWGCDKKPGNAWLREAKEAGDWNVAAAAAAAAQGSGLKAPKLPGCTLPPRADNGKSWSPNRAASIFSCRLHLARRFWNQTWKMKRFEIRLKCT